ncbi:MAG: vWA domain-containing protein [Myxococcaceae bacterium]
MNRTGIFLALAAGLALLALVVGLPRVTNHAPRPEVPGPAVTLDPVAPTASADGSIKMVGRLSHPYVGTGRSDLFVTVDLTGVEVPGAERSPVSLALVIDRSGSMSGFKLNEAKAAAKQLVAQLRSQDRLAIIHFGSDVKSMPGSLATADNKDRMLRYIDGIWDDGGTNIGAALQTARDHLLSSMSEYKVNRAILVSDGQPTEGMTDESGLTSLAREIRRHGISVSSLGVGNDFNEDLMQQLAEVGAGSYGYLQDISQLATIFQKDLTHASTTVAREVELSFTLPGGVELGEVLGYRSTQVGQVVKVGMTDFSAGQMERVVVRLTVNAPSAGVALDVTALGLSYTDLLKGSKVDSRLRLSAMTTDREDEVLARRDKDATVFAARAQSAWNMNKAAELVKRGDNDQAQAMIQQNNVLFDEAAAVAGPAAVEADRAEQSEVYQQFGLATGEEARQQAAKGAKSRSLKNFGRMGSTY